MDNMPIETISPPMITAETQDEENKTRQFMEKLSRTTVKELRFPSDSECLVNGKYDIVQWLGSGAYGNVYKVRDIRRCTMFALKIIKSHHRHSSSIRREVEILNFLNTVDPKHSKSLTVKMFRPFVFYRHICILYELLGPTVRKILLLNKRKGFPIQHVRHMTYQLCIALHFLRQNNIVHHDIKPDNVAFVFGEYDIEAETGLAIMRRTEIRLIDFGSAVFTHQKRLTTATTRVYRAPEMGLRFSWGYYTDVWSMGCSIFEIFTGHILLPCSSETDKYYMIQVIFSEGIPPEMGLTSKMDCFDRLGRLKHTVRAEEIGNKVKTFDQYNKNPGDTDTNLLFDLMKLMLRIVPSHRISAFKSLQHPFLKRYNLA